MERETGSRKTSAVIKAVAFGLITLIAYVFEFVNGQAVAGLFTAGQWYAAGPLVLMDIALPVAFVMSLVSAMRATQRPSLQPSQNKVVYHPKKASQRARARAYINPWHNM